MAKAITRRDFMRQSAYVALGAAIGVNIEAKKQARVVLVRHKNVLDENSRVDEKIVQQMLDKALMVLTGENTSNKAMKRLINPDDVVGIKSNEWAYMPTPPEMERSLERRILEAGVRKNNISIDDRGVLRNPVFKRSTAIINVRPIRTHYWAGIGGCIKNLIMFDSIPSRYHPDSCSNLALVWEKPLVQGKIRLNVLSALTPLYHGRGPHHFDRRYIWNYNGIIVGYDPVAVDAVGLEIIKSKRKEDFGKEIELKTTPKHIQVADTRYNLGTSDLNQIELIKLGWLDNILI